MKKLLVYLKDYKLESIVGPLFKLLEACFELIVPLLVADVINNGHPQWRRGGGAAHGADHGAVRRARPRLLHHGAVFRRQGGGGLRRGGALGAV